MYRVLVIGVSALWLFTSIACKKEVQTEHLTIAFGSCSHQDSLQDIGPSIVNVKPDYWLWLGDNIYADTNDFQAMRTMYAKQKNHSWYKKLRETTKIDGTWDDHDYGANDAGKEWHVKDGARLALLEFLDLKLSNLPAKGMQHAENIPVGKHIIKVIFLDTRYYRDPLETDKESEQRYLPNHDGTILGEDQWMWLETELKKKADFYILASSIQVIPTEHYFEKWSNFPNERKRLLQLIDSLNYEEKMIIISGDRHIAEIMDMDIGLTEFTSSGMTHPWKGAVEPNKYRNGELINSKNFGLIEFISKGKELAVEVSCRGVKDTIFFTHNVF